MVSFFPQLYLCFNCPENLLQSLSIPFSPLGKSVDNPTTYDVETQTFTVSSSTPIQFERMGVNTIPQKLFDCPASASLALPAGNLTAKTEEGDDDRTDINRLPKPQALVDEKEKFEDSTLKSYTHKLLQAFVAEDTTLKSEDDDSLKQTPRS